MPVLDRRISLRGPMFFVQGEELFFVNHIDGSTRDGPRPATEEDRSAHAGAYKAMFDRGEPFSPAIKVRDPEAKPASTPGPYAQRRAKAAEGADGR